MVRTPDVCGGLLAGGLEFPWDVVDVGAVLAMEWNATRTVLLCLAPDRSSHGALSMAAVGSLHSLPGSSGVSLQNKFVIPTRAVARAKSYRGPVDAVVGWPDYQSKEDQAVAVFRMSPVAMARRQRHR